MLQMALAPNGTCSTFSVPPLLLFASALFFASASSSSGFSCFCASSSLSHSSPASLSSFFSSSSPLSASSHTGGAGVTNPFVGRSRVPFQEVSSLIKRSKDLLYEHGCIRSLFSFLAASELSAASEMHQMAAPEHFFFWLHQSSFQRNKSGRLARRADLFRLAAGRPRMTSTTRAHPALASAPSHRLDLVLTYSW